MRRKEKRLEEEEKEEEVMRYASVIKVEIEGK